jgi:hypothetical protein
MTIKKTEEPQTTKSDVETSHPSRSLEPRARGYGIGGAYERPYRDARTTADERELVESYGPLPHSGYYGTGAAGSARFHRGQAGYDKELSWYGPQYGEITSGKREDS